MENNLTSDRRSVLTNSSWGAAQQIMLTGSNAVFGILIITVLSVEEYGAYSYATSLAALGQTVMTAGLSGLAVKALATAGDNSRRVVGTLLLLREFFGLAAFIAIVCIAFSSGSHVIFICVLVAAASLFGRALDAPEFWYQAHQRLAVPARVRIGISLAFFGLRIAAIFLSPNLWLFVLLFAAEGLVAGIAICVRYLVDKSAPGIGRPDPVQGKSLLRDSLPLFLSGIANQVNLRIDVVFIQIFLGTASVGIYSAAVRLAELTFMIPVVVMNTVFPILLKRRAAESPGGQYQALLQKSYTFAFWGGVGCALLTGAAGTVIIRFLFGEAYEQSIPLLWAQLIALPFIYMAAVFSKWIIAEHLLWASTVRHLAGALLAIVLNIVLLPIMGLWGSVVATVVAYISASYVACYLSRSTRPAAVAMNRAMLAPALFLISKISPIEAKE